MKKVVFAARRREGVVVAPVGVTRVILLVYINDPYNLDKYRFIFIKLVLFQIKHIHLLFL
jgi:hypothetical protein